MSSENIFRSKCDSSNTVKILTSLYPALIIILLLSLLATFATPAMLIASLAYFVLVTGFRVRRKNRKLHAILMTSAIAIDLSLVLILQINRDAVGTALSFSLSPLQQLHILASSIATLLYFPMLGLGFYQLKNPSKSPRVKIIHRNLGLATFVARSLGFLLMFSMLK
jgi:hypothetical protein